MSTDPIRFEFTFDEASYLRYERVASAVGAKAAKKDDIAARGGSTLVRLKLIDEPDFAHVGRMDFIDNVIEKGTGTIRGRAVFSNNAGILTPGMFARLQVPGSAPYTALLIPDSQSAASRRANSSMSCVPTTRWRRNMSSSAR